MLGESTIMTQAMYIRKEESHRTTHMPPTTETLIARTRMTTPRCDKQEKTMLTHFTRTSTTMTLKEPLTAVTHVTYGCCTKVCRVRLHWELPSSGTGSRLLTSVIHTRSLSNSRQHFSFNTSQGTQTSGRLSDSGHKRCCFKKQFPRIPPPLMTLTNSSCLRFQLPVPQFPPVLAASSPRHE